MRGKVLAITQLLLAGSFLLPRGGAADAANPALERKFAQTVRPFLTQLLRRMPRRRDAGRAVRSQALHHNGRRGPRLSSLEPGAGEADRERDAAEAGATAAGCGSASR